MTDLATSLLGARERPRFGFAVALLLAGALVGTMVEKARAGPQLLVTEPVPAEIMEGLQGYREMFTKMDKSLLPKVFHKQMSMSGLKKEDDLSSFDVLDYAGLEAMLDSFHSVFEGKKPWSSLPPEFQDFKGAVMIDATPPVKHYSLGPNEYVTEIHDKFARDGEVLVAWHTNLHWIKTPDGWRIKDKIYATL